MATLTDNHNTTEPTTTTRPGPDQTPIVIGVVVVMAVVVAVLSLGLPDRAGRFSESFSQSFHEGVCHDPDGSIDWNDSSFDGCGPDGPIYNTGRKVGDVIVPDGLTPGNDPAVDSEAAAAGGES